MVRTMTFVPPQPRVGGDPAGRLKAVHAGHPDVHQHHVGPLPDRRFDGFRAVLDVADDVDVLLIAQDGAEPGPDQRVVIGDEHADVSRHAPAHPPALPRRGISARTRQPVPLAGPASQLPPSAAARSRMPASPCPAAAGGAVGSRVRLAFVEHLDEHGAVAGLDPDQGLAGGGVAQHVGKPLLDDAVSGVADGRAGRLGRGARHLEVDGQPRLLHAGDEAAQAARSWTGCSGAGPSCAERSAFSVARSSDSASDEAARSPRARRSRRPRRPCARGARRRRRGR